MAGGCSPSGDEVLAEWVKRLRQTVKEAERLPEPILIDTFPALYDNLADVHPATPEPPQMKHGSE